MSALEDIDPVRYLRRRTDQERQRMAADPLDELGPLSRAAIAAAPPPPAPVDWIAWPIDLTVRGKPGKKGRPRFNTAQGRAYTPADTDKAEATIQGVWIISAGEHRLPDGPLEARIDAVYERPPGHYRKDGTTLSAEGQRHPQPCSPGHGDLDNIAKLALDALNGLAYADDRLIVTAFLRKRWAALGEHAHTRIRLRPYPED